MQIYLVLFFHVYTNRKQIPRTDIYDILLDGQTLSSLFTRYAPFIRSAQKSWLNATVPCSAIAKKQCPSSSEVPGCCCKETERHLCPAFASVSGSNIFSTTYCKAVACQPSEHPAPRELQRIETVDDPIHHWFFRVLETSELLGNSESLHSGF